MREEHIKYKLQDGTIVPGTTTVVESQLAWNSFMLYRWNNKLGLQGVNTKEYLKERAEIGILAHSMVRNWFLFGGTLGNECDDGYSREQIKAAKISYRNFMKWIAVKNIDPILIEKDFVSEKYQYGGKLDIYAEIDGVKELIDLKTGKEIYDNSVIQVGAYRLLLEEHGHEVEKVRIVGIPAYAGEDIKEIEIDERNCEIAKKIFLNCLENYYLRRKLNLNSNRGI